MNFLCCISFENECIFKAGCFQIDNIKRTWVIISEDPVGTGVNLFANLYNTDPKILKAFQFR